MINIRKAIKITLLITGIVIPIAGGAHFVIFPNETRSILVDFSDLKKEGSIYYNVSTPPGKIDSLKWLIANAAVCTTNFWGHLSSFPKFIYCDNEADFKKYCINPTAPAVTYLKLGSVIVLSADAVDLDIISHEYAHAEFYERIGFWKFNYAIPSWFKHGLAMQNDKRGYYSEDTLKVKSDNFKNLPDIKSMNSDSKFYDGTREQIMLNYMTAKYVIKKWYTKEKLSRLINDLSTGKSFQKAYGE